jgi:hypothetical protein
MAKVHKASQPTELEMWKVDNFIVTNWTPSGLIYRYEELQLQKLFYYHLCHYTDQILLLYECL